MNNTPPKIFISYSHEDEVWKDRLKKYLDVQVRLKNLIVWDDREIRTGEKWHPDIEKAILDCDIALLLVTTNFFNSSFIQEEEIPFIQKNNLKIMPIIIAPCDWQSFDYIADTQGFTKNNQSLEEIKEVEVKKELTRIVKELCSFDSSIIEVATSVSQNREEAIIQILQENIEIEFLQELTLKYLSEHYTKPIPDAIEEIVALLIAYGSGNQNIPIICVFNELNRVYAHIVEFKNYRDDLIVHFQEPEYQCRENKKVTERSFLIEFLKYEDNQYSIQVWEHFNNDFIQKELQLPEYITFDGDGIKLIFDELLKFFNQIRYRGINVYLEIILPVEKLSLGIKSWNYSGKRREKKVISKYKYVLRIQDRFREVDIHWESKWKKIEDKQPLKKNNSTWLTSQYHNDISEETTCVLSKTKIEDMKEVLYDIEEYNISIALLQQSENIDDKIYRELCCESVRNCKSTISTFICSNHNNDNSDMLFLLDDPNKIPEQFKNSAESLYGYN